MRHVVIVAVLLFAGTLGTGLIARGDVVKGAVIPEYFLGRNQHAMCTFHVSIDEPSLERRKESLWKFLQAAHDATENWKKHFVVLNADYLAFRGFFVALYHPCTEKILSSRLLSSAYGKSWHWKRENAQNLFSTEKFYQENSPVRMYFRYRPRVPIQACLVSMKASNSLPVEAYPNLYGLMYSTWRTFRPPFLYVGFRDRNFFVLFSRNCERREQIMKLYIDLMKRKDAKLASALQSPDLQRGAADFLSIFDAPPR